MTEKTRNIHYHAAAEGNGEHKAPQAGPSEAELEQMSLPEMRQRLEEALASLAEKEQALEQSQKEAVEYKDKYLRALAESENVRKRIRTQAEENARIQREALLRDLLGIIDNLERAVAAAREGGNGQPIVQGVEMVLRAMTDFLRSHGVTQVSAVGQPFDPLLHEAVESIESTRHQPNTVVDEFVRGYSIGDRVLRPARVAVSRLPAPASGGGQVENH